MTYRTFPVLVAINCFVSILCISSLSSQDAPTQSAATQKPVTGEKKIQAPSVAEIEARLQEVKANPDLEDVVKQSLTKRYEEALEAAKQAESYRQLEEDFSKALEVGPEQIKQLEAQIEEAKSESPPPLLDPSLSQEKVEERLVEVRREQAPLIARREDLEAKVAELKSRPETIPTEISNAKQELKKVRTDLGAIEPNDDASTQATIARLKAQFASLEEKIAMLEKEQASSEIRTTQTELSRDLLAEQIANTEARIGSLQERLADKLSRDMLRAEALIQKYSTTENIPDSSETEKAQNLERLLEELRTASESLDKATKETEERSERHQEVLAQYNTISTQFEKGVDSRSLSPLLHENLKKLPHPWDSSFRLRSIKSQISLMRSNLFEVKNQADLDGKKSEEEQTELETLTVTIRQGLISTYERAINELQELEATERSLQEISEEFREYAESKLFSVRSSTSLTPGRLLHFPEAMEPAIGPDRFAELGRLLKRIPAAGWAIMALVCLISAAIYPLLSRWLKKVGVRARHYSTEKFAQTILALTLTLLISLPIPTLLMILGTVIAVQNNTSEWARGFGSGLITVSKSLLAIFFLLEACRPNGLAESHFRWNRTILERLRRFCYFLIPVAFFTSLMLILASATASAETTVSPLGELTRIPLLLLVLGGGAALAYLMHPIKGVAAISSADSPDSLFGKMRSAWYWLVIGLIAILTVLLVAGYVYTVLQLTDLIVLSLWNIVVAFMIYGMLRRWVTIREHKIRRHQLDEEREKRFAESLKEKKNEDSVSEIASTDEVEGEEELDMGEVKEQSRRFIAFSVGLWLLWKLHSLWGGFGPLSDTIGQVNAIGPFSLGEILYTTILIAILVSTIRNLPGILEILVFQRTRIDEGTKTAIVSLANYTVIAIGAIELFRNLGVDWSQFGWIAAALSVGLGFGLQEVVANFVSGIILLFERPIRVGDVITVDGVDGKVSRIQIRATTILDWDRKELIVPNKRFITGTLKNWTRSNSINRIVIPVGVAYGSNTGKAREILLGIAEEHPEIMDDPAPLATFEGFGDSTLNLVLRAYLPTLDNRLGIITELHTLIDEKFSEAGIEIAFPQLDVHFSNQAPAEEKHRSDR